MLGPIPSAALAIVPLPVIFFACSCAWRIAGEFIIPMVPCITRAMTLVWPFSASRN